MTQTAPESLGSRILVLAVLLSMLLVIVACVWLMGETQPPLRWLESWPGLAVERGVRYALPKGAIVHVRDWHTAPDQAGDDRHLADVEAVQAEQVELLRELLKRGYRTVGVEGLTATGLKAWEAKIDVLNEQEADQPKLREMIAHGGEIGKEAAKLARQHRWEVAEMGAAARLMMEGESLTVFALDDGEALERATPRKVGGRWEFDAVKVKERRRAIVRNCLATKANVVIVILGASHDLAEQVRGEADGWAYLRLSTEAVRGLLQGHARTPP